MTAAGALSRFLRPAPPPRAGEACELCSAPLDDAAHPHVVDVEQRALRCACRACAVLFRQPGAGRWRTVPDRVLHDPGLALTAADWASVEIPVGLAFLVRSADGGWTAIYPGPAGAVESTLPLEAWTRLAARTSLAAECAADVEALLVRAGRDGAVEVLLVPVDRCYELAGRLRRVWRGFDGGAEARAEVDAFLAALRARARPVDRRVAT